jgi:predicted naringenin-chalcone synthase
MKIYEKEALKLAVRSVNDMNLRFPLNEVTHLITFSCTGMYAPGLDIDLVSALGLKSNIQRFSVNFMGCYAGLTVLKLADSIVRADPNARVLAVGVEICSIHFQKALEDDFLLSNALFGDGAASFVVESAPRAGKNILNQAFQCELIPEGSGDMAWHIRDFGFEMRLSSYIPKLINGSMNSMLNDLFQDLHISTKDVRQYAIHPGGRKILDTLSETLKLKETDLDASYEVLNQYGNMSSVTVIFVLRQLLTKLGDSDNGDSILSMAFGPGLTMESALLSFRYV